MCLWGLRQVLRRDLPILTVVTVLAAWPLWDGVATRFDAIVPLAVFGGLIGWTIWQGMQEKADAIGSDMEQKLDVRAIPSHR